MRETKAKSAKKNIKPCIPIAEKQIASGRQGVALVSSIPISPVPNTQQAPRRHWEMSKCLPVVWPSEDRIAVETHGYPGLPLLSLTELSSPCQTLQKTLQRVLSEVSELVPLGYLVSNSVPTMELKLRGLGSCLGTGFCSQSCRMKIQSSTFQSCCPYHKFKICILKTGQPR